MDHSLSTFDWVLLWLHQTCLKHSRAVPCHHWGWGCTWSHLLTLLLNFLLSFKTIFDKVAELCSDSLVTWSLRAVHRMELAVPCSVSRDGILRLDRLLFQRFQHSLNHGWSPDLFVMVQWRLHVATCLQLLLANEIKRVLNPKAATMQGFFSPGSFTPLYFSIRVDQNTIQITLAHIKHPGLIRTKISSNQFQSYFNYIKAYWCRTS